MDQEQEGGCGCGIWTVMQFGLVAASGHSKQKRRPLMNWLTWWLMFFFCLFSTFDEGNYFIDLKTVSLPTRSDPRQPFHLPFMYPYSLNPPILHTHHKQPHFSSSTLKFRNCMSSPVSSGYPALHRNSPYAGPTAMVHTLLRNLPRAEPSPASFPVLTSSALICAVWLPYCCR